MALFQIANQIPGLCGQNVMLAVVLFFLEVVVPHPQPSMDSLKKIFALFEEEEPKTNLKGKDGSWDCIEKSLQAIVFRWEILGTCPAHLVVWRVQMFGGYNR
jgi:hypothetical protein